MKHKSKLPAIQNLFGRVKIFLLYVLPVLISGYASAQCIDPDIPLVTQTVNSNCSVTLSISSGNLNDATDWQWYEGGCGTTSIGSGISITVSPATTVTYYVRGEGGCILTPGTCAQFTVTPGTPTDWYIDADLDSYGSSSATPVSCGLQPDGYVADNTDCNDADPLIHPNEPESCNGIDDDCDGTADDGISFTNYYTDNDNDGYGTGAALSLCADPGSGYSQLNGDCDDDDIQVNPGESEICNDIDDNCDTFIDEGFTQFTFYADNDGDGYGSGTAIITCNDPGLNYVMDVDGDCNDNDAQVNPGADEICNGIDDDCDGIQVTHTITVVQPLNGSITPAGPVTVNCGADSPPFYTIANVGYVGSDIYVDNVYVGIYNPYTFLNVQADHTITAQFTPFSCANSPTMTPGGSLTQYCSNGAGTFDVTISNASTVTWTTTGLGTLTNPFDNSGQFFIDYEPAAGDIGNTVTVTATTEDPDGAGPCTAASHTFSFTVVAAPVVNPGTYPAACEDDGLILLSGSPSGGTFTGTDVIFQSGSYYFDPSISGEGSYIIEYNYFDGTCNGTAQTIINIEDCNAACSNPVEVNAGPDLNICLDGDGTLGAIITGAVTTGQWIGGAGTFIPNRTTLNATYVPHASESGTVVTLILISDTPAPPCVADSDTVLLTISTPYELAAGPDIRVCADGGSVQLNGQIYAGGPGVTWTGGLGTFTPDRDAANAEYTPDPSEAGTIVYLTFNGNNPNNVCPVITDEVEITVDAYPAADAGNDQASCGGGTITLNGSSLNAAGGYWSGGLGTFTPDANTGNAVYTPDIAELNSTVTLTWTTSDPFNVCPAAFDDMDIVIEEVTVNAGPDIHVCVEEGSVGLNGIVTGGSGTGTWSGGLGTFDNPSSLSTIYNPSPLEAGTEVILTLSSSGSVSCPAVSDQVSIFVDDVPYVNAGPDISTCVDGTVNLNAQISGGTVLVEWSGGLGTFSDINDPAAVYTPDPSEAGTIVTLSIQSYGAPGTVCLPGYDEIDITIDEIPVANAGTDQIICWNETINLSGTVSGGGNGSWSTTSGGTFGDENSLITTYTPSASDLAAGFAVLSLTADFNGQCPGTYSDVTITLNPEIILTSSVTNVDCNGFSNGEIQVIATGGTAPYQYQLDALPQVPSDLFTGLNAGTYTVTVEDANGCTSTLPVTITEPSALSVSLSQTAETCAGNDGSATAIVNGGTSPYNYEWNTGAVTSSLTGITSGTYTVTVTDDRGCPAVIESISVNGPLPGSCGITLNVRSLVQGYFDDLSSEMRTVLLNSGVSGSTALQSDTLEISLMSDVSPYAMVATLKGVADVEGNVSLFFNTPGLSGNNFYIRVMNRNAIETWSANPVLMNTVTSYDFTTSSSQAFGNNQVQLSSGEYALWSGDISDGITDYVQDGVISSNDYSLIENEVQAFLSGYIASDITGDGVISSDDYSLIENNVQLFISVVRP